MKEQSTRDPNQYKLCSLYLNPIVMDIDDFTFDDIKFDNYQSFPSIKAEIAV